MADLKRPTWWAPYSHGSQNAAQVASNEIRALYYNQFRKKCPCFPVESGDSLLCADITCLRSIINQDYFLLRTPQLFNVKMWLHSFVLFTAYGIHWDALLLLWNITVEFSFSKASRDILPVDQSWPECWRSLTARGSHGLHFSCSSFWARSIGWS